VIFESLEHRLPLLITGLAGVPGYNAFAYFRRRYPGQVFAIRREEYWPLAGPDVIPCNSEDPLAVRDLLDQYQFRSVLHTGGSCALKSCELDPLMARRVNVSGIDNIIRQIHALQQDVRMVCLSIDLVFSGAQGGNHLESDRAEPVTEYGKSMLEAENLIARERPDAAIVRISLPMGVSFNGHAGAIDWIQNRFKNGRPATLYFDEVRTPTYVECMNQVMQTLLAQDIAGLFHAGGVHQLSLYEIAQIVNRVGGYDPDLLHGCYRLQAGPMPPRAGNVTMISDKLREAIGYTPFDPWPFYERFIPCSRDWHYRRPSAEPGSPKLLSETLYHNPNRDPASRPELLARAGRA
jgi:dTDP-4-dehydrorhamnose reductase